MSDIHARNMDIKKVLEDTRHPPSLDRLRWRNDVVTPRIMVAAHPKSGSTWVTGALAKLVQYDVVRFCYAWSSNEHDLYPPALIVRKDRGEISQMHVRATPHNVTLIQDFAIKPVVLTRNVFDTVVSVARDIQKKHENSKAAPGVQGYSFVWFSSLPQDAELEDYIDYSIDFFIPWYINFLLSWECYRRHTASIFVRYEDVRTNPKVEFSSIVEKLKLERVSEIDYASDPLSSSSMISSTKSENFSGLEVLGAARIARIKSLFRHCRSPFCTEHLDEA